MEGKRHIREYVTAGLFLLALAGGAALWLCSALFPQGGDYAGMRALSKGEMLSQASAPLASARDTPPARTQAEQAGPATPAQALEELAGGADEAINSALDRNHGFIQLYGGVQRLLGRRILEDVDKQYTVYRLSDGALTFVNPEPAQGLEGYADSYLTFRDALAEAGTPLLYLQAPQKIGGEGTPRLPAGVSDYGNQSADDFLSLITAGGASVLDLRQGLAQAGEDWTGWFYATDHHWTPEAALYCVGELAGYMNQAYGLKLDLSLTDPARYAVRVYEDGFLGSQGKRTGSLYAGADDFTVWTPDFETEFTYAIPINQVTREGSFEETLLFPERLEEDDPFQANPYTLYSGGDYSFTRITNHKNPDGPKVMLLRDSFGCVFSPFLALHCSELTTIDLRYFYDHFPTYVEWIDPDYVVVLYSPGALYNSMAFDFFSEGLAAGAQEGDTE